MITTIYKSPPDSPTRWLIEQRHGDPALITFTKWGRSKLLDQVARWTGSSWDRARWVPQAPIVPEVILRKVIRHLEQTGVKG